LLTPFPQLTDDEDRTRDLLHLTALSLGGRDDPQTWTT